MAIRSILQYPDKRLRDRAEPIAAVTPEVRRSSSRTWRRPCTRRRAAGSRRRRSACRCGCSSSTSPSEDEPSDLRVFINPEILAREGKNPWEEGCLSFPGVHEEIERAAKVTVRATNGGAKCRAEAEGLSLSPCSTRTITSTAS